MTSAEHHKILCQKWRRKHKKYIKIKDREYREKNRERCKIACKNWRMKNTDYLVKQREWEKKNAAKFLFTKCKKNAKKRNKTFSLTLSWVEKKLATGICEQTGKSFIFNKDPLERCNPWRPSIDRVDSSLGYSKTNCQMVCAIYNMGKSDWTDTDMLEMAKGIIRKYENTEIM